MLCLFVTFIPPEQAQERLVVEPMGLLDRKWGFKNPSKKHNAKPSIGSSQKCLSKSPPKTQCHKFHSPPSFRPANGFENSPTFLYPPSISLAYTHLSFSATSQATQANKPIKANKTIEDEQLVDYQQQRS